MPEALTESFCERCGTRYEFAAPTELSPLRKTRGVISGLKNYLMSQDALGDAVGDAIRNEESQLASQQLDAFHDSFNFCIDCRQYTCVNCWNDDSGRCRSCVPIAGTDDLLEQFESTFHAQHPELYTADADAEMADAEIQRRLGIEAWPSSDLAALNGHEPAEAATAPTLESTEEEPAFPGEPEPLPEPVAAEVEVEVEVEPEPLPEPVAAEVEPEVEVEPEPLPEPVAAEIEPEPVHSLITAEEAATAPTIAPIAPSVVWEQDGEWEPLPEPVAAEVEVEVEVEPEPLPEPVAAEVEVEVEPEPLPEPVAAEVEVEVDVEPEPVPVPEPVRPMPIRPISETILHLPQRAPEAEAEFEPEPEPVERVAAEADDPALAARRAKLDMLGLEDPGEGTVTSGAPNVLPYRSRGASVHPAEVAAHAGQAVGRSFWEASAREVAGAASQIGVQSCGACGLSLSASARFCRRCGTRQAQSA
jgi:hypothetical protein